MGFVLSKVIGWLVDPVHLAVALVLVVLVLRLARRAAGIGRALATAAVAELWVFGTGAVASLLLTPLETKHVRPAALPVKPAVIVMLTGVTDDSKVSPSYYELNDASERIVETVRLARLYPQAQVVISGGSGALIQTGRKREADVLGVLAQELGLPRSRLRLEPASRNTYENAVQTTGLLAGVKGPVLLVTSAAHMPRAVACFEKLGLTPIPWPVDHQRQSYGPGSFLPSIEALMRSRSALHEYVGLAYYRLAGLI